jgi:hypothetical protein
MSINLIEKVQQNLGYAPLQKIDPNEQQLNHNEVSVKDKFGQVALPAVLTGLYKFVQTDKGAAMVLEGDTATNWQQIIFEDHKAEVVEKLAGFTSKSGNELSDELNGIANETITIAKQQLAEKAGVKEVKQFFSDQRNNILLYLPAALNMGQLLHDNTMDDKTNKMEGPISSLIKNIGNAFSSPVTEEELKNKE